MRSIRLMIVLAIGACRPPVDEGTPPPERTLEAILAVNPPDPTAFLPSHEAPDEGQVTGDSGAAETDVPQESATPVVVHETGETAETAVEVVNQPPLCAIAMPAGPVAVAEGDTVYFDVDATDPEGDPVVAVWSSGSVMRVIGDAFEYILPAGHHLVTVDVDDVWGNRCSDDVNVTVQ